MVGFFGLESIVYGLLQHEHEFVWVGIGFVVFALTGSSCRPNEFSNALNIITSAKSDKEKIIEEYDAETTNPPFVIVIERKDTEPTNNEKD